MQIRKEWQHLTKPLVKECVFTQQDQPHTHTYAHTGIGRKTRECIAVLFSLFSFFHTPAYPVMIWEKTDQT